MITEKEYSQLKLHDSLVFVGNGSTIINGFTKGDIVTIVDKYDMDDYSDHWGCIIVKGSYKPNTKQETFHFADINIMRYFSKLEEFYSPENLKSEISDVQSNTLIGNKEVKIPEKIDSSEELYVDNFEQVTSWKRALNAARTTVGKKILDKEPSDSWKAKMFLAEHSPIRLVTFSWIWKNIKCFVQQHLTRHHIGCEKFVSTQRSDRNLSVGDRDLLPQGAKQDFWFEGNLQSLINISRKRRCNSADPQTRKAWLKALDEIEKVEPIIGRKLKLGRECVYRGFCPELNCCGYVNTEQYQKDLEEYRKRDY